MRKSRTGASVEHQVGAVEIIRILLALSAFGTIALIIGGQILGWLRTGHWHGMALVDWIAPETQNAPFWAWLAAPHSWYGLRAIIKGLLYGWPLWVWIAMAYALADKFLEYHLVFEKRAANYEIPEEEEFFETGCPNCGAKHAIFMDDSAQLTCTCGATLLIDRDDERKFCGVQIKPELQSAPNG